MASTFASPDIDECLEIAEKCSLKLVEALGSIGMKLNTSKEEAQAWLRGAGSHAATRKLFATRNSIFRSYARYLGPHLHWSGSFHDERERRIHAARSAWFAFHKFWFSAAPVKF